VEFTVDDAIKERAGKVRLNVDTMIKNGDINKTLKSSGLEENAFYTCRL
jgi:hypothetical protein